MLGDQIDSNVLCQATAAEGANAYKSTKVGWNGDYAHASDAADPRCVNQKLQQRGKPVRPLTQMHTFGACHS